MIFLCGQLYIVLEGIKDERVKSKGGGGGAEIDGAAAVKSAAIAAASVTGARSAVANDEPQTRRTEAAPSGDIELGAVSEPRVFRAPARVGVAAAEAAEARASSVGTSKKVTGGGGGKPVKGHVDAKTYTTTRGSVADASDRMTDSNIGDAWVNNTDTLVSLQAELGMSMVAVQVGSIAAPTTGGASDEARIGQAARESVSAVLEAISAGTESGAEAAMMDAPDPGDTDPTL